MCAKRHITKDELRLENIPPQFITQEMCEDVVENAPWLISGYSYQI